jgi:hypothetical protein
MVVKKIRSPAENDELFFVSFVNRNLPSPRTKWTPLLSGSWYPSVCRVFGILRLSCRLVQSLYVRANNHRPNYELDLLLNWLVCMPA